MGESNTIVSSYTMYRLYNSIAPTHRYADTSHPHLPITYLRFSDIPSTSTGVK